MSYFWGDAVLSPSIDILEQTSARSLCLLEPGSCTECELLESVPGGLDVSQSRSVL